MAQIRSQKWFVFLTALASLSFLVMVCLFGLTGSYAPVAFIDNDKGPLSRQFKENLLQAYHSFALKDMSLTQAQESLLSGKLAGIITIPAGFSKDVGSGHTIPIKLQIDNVNVDLTNDIQRALPAAIVDFGWKNSFPGVRVQMVEHDVIPHDTFYIPYLVVSALALDAMVIAGILGAMATAREIERKTLKLLRLSPASLNAVLAGKLAVSAFVASAALALTLLVIVFGYGVVPVAPVTTVAVLLLCVAIFTCLGAWLGVLLKRTMVVVPLMFGLAMPFYIDSGALEPTRFDGQSIWLVAHLSPIYYAVGVLEWAFHGLHVTPELPGTDLLILLGIAFAAIILTKVSLAKDHAR